MGTENKITLWNKIKYLLLYGLCKVLHLLLTIISLGIPMITKKLKVLIDEFYAKANEDIKLTQKLEPKEKLEIYTVVDKDFDKK